MTMTKARLRAFVLSRTIEVLGHSLTTQQATVLDIAQTLTKKFMRGKAVGLPEIERLAQEYHQISRPDIRDAVADLAERGVLILRMNVNSRPEIRLPLKLAGLRRDEVTEDNAGVGRVA